MAEPPSQDPDARCVERARWGDPAAIAELVARHQGVVYRYLLARTEDEDRAADLTQEAFLKGLRALPGFRGESSFRTWMLSIARNELLGHHRKTERRGEERLESGLQVQDSAPSPEDSAEQAEAMGHARRLLLRLPEKQRLSVWLRLYDGLSFREIAEATESTEGAARVNYFHGIRKLREWSNDGI